MPDKKCSKGHRSPRYVSSNKCLTCQRKSDAVTNRARKLRQRYSLTPEQVAHIAETQQGRCFICEQPAQKLNVDHCHDSKIVRGLLCKSCNTGLGNFKDNLKFLRRAITYLMLPVTSRMALKREIIKLLGSAQAV